ncbi:hypothetical protein JTB14_036584 [Gonioctena quinquepunctata]|nr:hypothetical protein JTB14_036584 [Gonioctena quinquepunctata]
MDVEREETEQVDNDSREVFINSLRITPTRVTTALKKANNRDAVLLNQRGKQQGGLNKIPFDKVLQISDAFKIKLQGESDEHYRQLLQIQLDSYQDLANKARTSLKEDMEKAQNENCVEGLTFDLQKTLLCLGFQAIYKITK